MKTAIANVYSFSIVKKESGSITELAKWQKQPKGADDSGSKLKLVVLSGKTSTSTNYWSEDYVSSNRGL